MIIIEKWHAIVYRAIDRIRSALKANKERPRGTLNEHQQKKTQRKESKTKTKAEKRLSYSKLKWECRLKGKARQPLQTVRSNHSANFITHNTKIIISYTHNVYSLHIPSIWLSFDLFFFIRFNCFRIRTCWIHCVFLLFCISITESHKVLQLKFILC